MTIYQIILFHSITYFRFRKPQGGIRRGTPCFSLRSPPGLHASGHDHDIDIPGVIGQQLFRCGVQCRAGGHNIVNQ